MYKQTHSLWFIRFFYIHVNTWHTDRVNVKSSQVKSGQVKSIYFSNPLGLNYPHKNRRRRRKKTTIKACITHSQCIACLSNPSLRTPLHTVVRHCAGVTPGDNAAEVAVEVRGHAHGVKVRTEGLVGCLRVPLAETRLRTGAPELENK